MPRSKPEVIKSVTSHHWGAGVAHVVDGELRSVDAHPGDPDTSPINGNLTSLKSRARVRRPAIRRGYLESGPGNADGMRGQDSFVEVSWDEALDAVAAELTRVRKSHGNESIFAGSYGWASAGRFHHAQSQLKRFLTTAGGFVRSEGNYSYNAALVLMPHIVGNFRQHVKEATRWTTVAQDGELVVMFGGIPLRNAQVSGGGIAKHTLRGDLVSCCKAGVEFVNFSPLRTDAIDELGARWHAPRPGSDTAIMMGLAHTLLTENLHDTEFLDRYTVGFDKIANYLLGKDDGVVKDVNWAQERSGIDATVLRDLAHQMAKRRTLICMAVGLQRTEYGEQPLWMTVTLAAMLGQIGLPGGGYGIGYGADASIGTTDRPIRWPFFPQPKNPVEDYIPVAAISDLLLNPGGTYQYNGEERTYADIKLVWWAGGNPFHHHQDLNRLREAFQQPETVIVNEINWTATARHADIVLPCTSPLERDDIGAGTQDRAVIPMRQVMPPVDEARNEYDIYCELSARLNLGEAFSEGRTSRQWLDHMWQQLQTTAARENHTLPDFEQFLDGDIITFDDPDANGVFLQSFRQDPVANSLPTPSGKIELYSKVINSFGYEDCPGHAVWRAPKEWLGAASTSTYSLHLISGQPQTRLHSQLDNGEYSRSFKVKDREPILINPADAAARDIKDGDIVSVFNARGRCLAGAVVTEDVRENVVFLWTGAWYDPDFTRSDHCDLHGNPNVLTHDGRTSRLSQGPAAHSALVEIQKFAGTPPPVQAFEAPLS